MSLPPGAIALPGPNGTILWATPQSFAQQQAGAAGAGAGQPDAAYQLLPSALLQQLSQQQSALHSPPMSSFSLSSLSSLSPSTPLSSLPPLSQPLASAPPSQGGAAGLFPSALTGLPGLSALSSNGSVATTGSPLSSLNLSSLLMPYAAMQGLAPVQPLGGASGPAPVLSSSPFPMGQSALGGASGQAHQLTVNDGPASASAPAASNAALLQLQATLLQVAQTGNQQAIQQLQGLNALMQHVSSQQQQQQPQPTASHSMLMALPPFAAPSTAPIGGEVGVGVPSGYLSSAGRHSAASLLAEPSVDSSPSQSQQQRLVNSGGSSAFKPRAKRDRENGRDGGYSTTSNSSGGNSSSGSGNGSAGSPAPSHHRHLSGGRGVSRAQALKSSHLRADVREAVAAGHLLDKVKEKEKAKDKQANAPSPPFSASSRDDSSSGGGAKSSSSGSDEDGQYKQEADDEEDDERNNKRRRRKNSAGGLHHLPSSAAHKQQLQHPFHLFSNLEPLKPQPSLQSQPSPQSAPATLPSLSDGTQVSKDGAGSANPFLYLYMPQPNGTPGMSQPISQQLSHLGLSDVHSDHLVSDVQKSNRAAALSALSSFLHNTPQTPTLPTESLLTGDKAQLQLLQQIQQHQQQQQLRQLSSPSALSTPPTSGLHGVPLQLVSQHLASQQQPLNSASLPAQSGDNAGSLSSAGGGSSGSHGGVGVLGLAAVGGKKLRKKHIVTDRQRRAKIKDGMEQLRSLLSSHGSFTTDQVSIMMASVQLIQKLREEVSLLKSHTGELKQQLDRYKQTFGSLAAMQATQHSSPLLLDSAQLAALSLDPSMAPLAILSTVTGDAANADSAMSTEKDASSAGVKIDSPPPSRSPSLIAPMAALGMGGIGSTSPTLDCSEGQSRTSEEPSSPPPSDERADDGDSQGSGSDRSQSDERSSPNPFMSERTFSGDSTSSDSAAADHSSANIGRQSSQTAMVTSS